MEKIKVFLSDPQVLFREGIHFILSGEEDFEVTGEATGNEEALASIQTNPPNVVIISQSDPGLDGAEAARRIKRAHPTVIVVLTMEKKDSEQIFAAMKSGASACLTKDIDPDSLLNTIREVSRGSSPLADELQRPEIATMVMTEFDDTAALNQQVDNLLAGLTTRESQILGHIAAGNNVAQIAAKLDTSEAAVRQHLRLILNKLVANDQAKAIIEAAQRSFPAIIRGTVKRPVRSADYVTRAEFNEFKDNLLERLKAFLGELRQS